ncbi:EscJ/YscJ/HrcJ family type III secretion inner membrane ring protein [Burkholderia sp. Bp9126]|nr:EscJ/YscJ/HrcJ family type III secretion inner membrane ring protein [Burkholderia sp. Bp9126]
MTLHLLRLMWAGTLILSLAGCKTELYTNLSEEEANQMTALLMLRNIAVEKTMPKDGNVTIRVESSQFVNAVELMRQNGLPHHKTATLDDLFPTGQLVTSPSQEHAKLTFLKEQRLEEMLRAMNGVVDAQVSIAEGESRGRRDPPQPTASVYVKYSPERNLTGRETDIRSLVVTATPGLSAERVSIVLQPADYRYQMRAEEPAEGQTRAPVWLRKYRLTLGVALGVLGTIAGLAFTFVIWRDRSSGKRHKS